MTVVKTFNKMAPVAESSLLRVFGVNPTGYAIFLENQDVVGGNVITYTFQESVDGATWTDIQFSVNGNPQADFALLPGASHLLKVSSSNPYIRLTAYGDAPMAVSVCYQRPSNVNTSEVSIFESA